MGTFGFGILWGSVTSLDDLGACEKNPRVNSHV